MEDFYKNCSIQFVLLDPNGKLVAEGKTFLFKHFCLQDHMEMKAEKQFGRIVLHSPKLDTFILDVSLVEKFDNS